MKDITAIFLTQTISEELQIINTQCINSFLETTSGNNACAIVIENNSIGSVYADRFKTALSRKTGNTGVMTTNDTNAIGYPIYLLANNIKYTYIAEPFNMNRFYNIGADIADKSRYYMFANSDLVFNDGWFDDCLRVFDKYHNAANVIPASSLLTYQFRKATENCTKSHEGFRLGSERNEIVEVTPPAGPGWMFLFPDWFFTEFGRWPEELSGWRQDWHAHMKIKHLGYKSYVTYNSTVNHLEGQNFRPLRINNPAEFKRLVDTESVYHEVLKKELI